MTQLHDVPGTVTRRNPDSTPKQRPAWPLPSGGPAAWRAFNGSPMAWPLLGIAAKTWPLPDGPAGPWPIDHVSAYCVDAAQHGC